MVSSFSPLSLPSLLPFELELTHSFFPPFAPPSLSTQLSSSLYPSPYSLYLVSDPTTVSDPLSSPPTFLASLPFIPPSVVSFPPPSATPPFQLPSLQPYPRSSTPLLTPTSGNGGSADSRRSDRFIGQRVGRPQVSQEAGFDWSPSHHRPGRGARAQCGAECDSKESSRWVSENLLLACSLPL